VLDRFADWLDRQAPGRRRLYSVFIALALLTIPCYASATLLWFFNTPGGTSISTQDATSPPDSDAEATLSLPTDEAEELPASPLPPTRAPQREKDAEPEPTLAPRPTLPPVQTATPFTVPTPILRASPSPESTATEPPTLAPTDPPTEAASETPAPPEPSDVPEEPSPTPPIQVTLDP
jgi:hypothetical protein